jgi:hypothetical protein
MPFIPRQVKPPARLAITCKVPEAVATLLKHYAEFLESSQEHVVTETLRLAFRRDREFQIWLATTHPEARLADRPPLEGTTEPPREAPAPRERGRS